MKSARTWFATAVLLSACSAPTPADLPSSPLRPQRALQPGAPANNILSGQVGGILSNNGAAIIANNGARFDGAAPPVGSARDDRFRMAEDLLRQAPGTTLSGSLTTTRGPVTLTWGDAGGGLLMWGETPQPPELTTTTDAQGVFRFSGLVVISPALLRATWEDPSGQGAAGGELHFLVFPGEQQLRLVEADGGLGTYLLTRMIASHARPEAALAALTAELLAPARQAFAKAWAAEPPLRDFTPVTLVTTIDTWLQRYPDLVEALDAIRRTTLRAAQQALGAGKPATEVDLPLIRGLAAASDGSAIIVNSAVVWQTTSAGLLAPLLGTGQEANALPAQGLPASEVALAPLGPVAVGAAGSVVALVQATPGDSGFPGLGRGASGGKLAAVQRDAQGALRVLATWAPDELEGETPVAVELGADRRLTVWTAAANSEQPSVSTDDATTEVNFGPSPEDEAFDAWEAEAETKSAGLWRLAQAGSAPPTVSLRAWRWDLFSTTPATAAPLRGDKVVTPVGAPPGSSSTWRLSNGVFEQVGLDGAVLSVGGRLSTARTAEIRWCNTPDGAVLVNVGAAVYRLQGGKATRIAGVASAVSDSDANGGITVFTNELR